ncbi:hypothetical protein AB7M17_007305 [Bradyrhizobium sp. USDA 377]
MAASLSSPLRCCGALLVLLAGGAALAGCAGISETVAPAFADPARYDLYDCKQLESERKGLASRTTDLQRLMDKAETGAGGVVVSELAYRNEYVAVRGQAQLVEDAWRRNRCRETPPDAKPTTSAPQPPVIKPAPARSGSAAR